MSEEQPQQQPAQDTPPPPEGFPPETPQPPPAAAPPPLPPYAPDPAPSPEPTQELPPTPKEERGEANPPPPDVSQELPPTPKQEREPDNPQTPDVRGVTQGFQFPQPDLYNMMQGVQGQLNDLAARQQQPLEHMDVFIGKVTGGDASAGWNWNELVMSSGAWADFTDGRWADNTDDDYMPLLVLPKNATPAVGSSYAFVELLDPAGGGYVYAVLVGGNPILVRITAHTGSGALNWNPYTAVSVLDGTSYSIYNGFEDNGSSATALQGTPGSLGVTVASDGTVNSGSCKVQPIGSAMVMIVWDAKNARWAFSQANSAQ